MSHSQPGLTFVAVRNEIPFPDDHCSSARPRQAFSRAWSICSNALDSHYRDDRPSRARMREVVMKYNPFFQAYG